jgi:hypothetical protein
MTEYVRVCPRCDQATPEYENICAYCQNFIGMEEAVLASSIASFKAESTGVSAEIPAATVMASPSGDGEDPALLAGNTTPRVPVEPLTRRFVANEPTLFLEIARDTHLPVYPGWRLGQPHPGNDAEIQLPNHLPGIEFVHRQHCCFEHRSNQWYVIAIDQRSLGRDFTNPTLVNNRILPPGQQVLLSDGDELRLSGIKITVTAKNCILGNVYESYSRHPPQNSCP